MPLKNAQLLFNMCKSVWIRVGMMGSQQKESQEQVLSLVIFEQV